VDVIIGNEQIKNAGKRGKWKADWATKKLKIQRKFDSINKRGLIKNERE
jgi:hypothetical protein